MDSRIYCTKFFVKKNRLMNDLNLTLFNNDVSTTVSAGMESQVRWRIENKLLLLLLTLQRFHLDPGSIQI
jgi:hypothetical protein